MGTGLATLQILIFYALTVQETFLGVLMLISIAGIAAYFVLALSRVHREQKFLIEAETKGASSLRGLVKELVDEAREAGAKKLSIIGHEVINEGLLNQRTAERFGFRFRQVNEKTVELTIPIE